MCSMFERNGGMSETNESPIMLSRALVVPFDAMRFSRKISLHHEDRDLLVVDTLPRTWS